jgi:hypothetical protein
MNDNPTFVCKDCGVAVYDALGEVRERCGACQWLADLPNARDREECRQWLIEIGVITEADRLPPSARP